MNKIPTVEEFATEYNESRMPRGVSYQKEIGELMIEFAKLHVEAAIKECIENAPSGSSTDTVSYEDVVKALKDCYPLENIK